MVYLCKRIPRWLGMTRLVKATQFLLFPVLLLLPMADELIGRWQFKRLCEREAVMNLSPDWRKVKRAKSVKAPITQLEGYVIRILEQPIEYLDMDTDQQILKYKAFHTKGGFLMDRLGLGLGGGLRPAGPETMIKSGKKLIFNNFWIKER